VWWRRTGLLDQILDALQLKLDTHGLIDWQQWSMDGSIVRAHRAAAGALTNRGVDGDTEPPDHALGRSVGGFTTKIHLLADSNGLPLGVVLSAGQVHESTQVETILSQVALPRVKARARRRPKRLAADRAYDAQRIRHYLRRLGIQAVIPPIRRRGKRKPGRPVTYNRTFYRLRSSIEQCVGWLKECRALATRYDKLALNYLGMVKLAIIRRYLRLLTRLPTALVPPTG
jgi:transposase